MKVPAEIVNAIDQIAERRDASKTEVVIAMLNEGLRAPAIRERFGEVHP